jgi:hypothetical protein
MCNATRYCPGVTTIDAVDTDHSRYIQETMHIGSVDPKLNGCSSSNVVLNADVDDRQAHQQARQSSVGRDSDDALRTTTTHRRHRKQVDSAADADALSDGAKTTAEYRRHRKPVRQHHVVFADESSSRPYARQEANVANIESVNWCWPYRGHNDQSFGQTVLSARKLNRLFNNAFS